MGAEGPIRTTARPFPGAKRSSTHRIDCTFTVSRETTRRNGIAEAPAEMELPHRFARNDQPKRGTSSSPVFGRFVSGPTPREKRETILDRPHGGGAVSEIEAAVRVLLASGDPAAHRFGSRLRNWLLSSDAAPLEAALGIACEPGQRSFRTRRAIADRDVKLRAAAATLPAEWSVARRAEAVATALRRYAATAWPRERSLDACPRRHVGRMEEHLWRAMRAHPRPIGARQVRCMLNPRTLGSQLCLCSKV